MININSYHVYSFTVRHQIFDEYGKVIFSKEVKDNPGPVPLNSYKIERLYDVIADGRLYKCDCFGGHT